MANELGIQEIGGEISLHDIIHFDFTNTTSVNIEDIIIHLQGLEKVSRKVPEILDKLVSELNNRKYYFNKGEAPKIVIAKLNNDAGIIGATI